MEGIEEEKVEEKVIEKVIVTGGAGFIGSHLCDYLLNKNYKVICVDNLITGNLNNIKHLENNKNFVFMNHDITKPLYVNNDMLPNNMLCRTSARSVNPRSGKSNP